MIKKILFYAFIIISLLMFNLNSVAASKVSCQYELTGGNYRIDFDEDGSKVYFNDQLTINIYGGNKVTDPKDCPKGIKFLTGNIIAGDDNAIVAEEKNGTNATWLDEGDKVSCGNIGEFSNMIPKTTSMIITIIMITAPVLLIILGSIDFLKAVMGVKEDDIKKHQKAFFNRLISAALVFLVIALTRVLISITASGVKSNIVNCVDCFISNKCK